jgi:hypothetical protein
LSQNNLVTSHSLPSLLSSVYLDTKVHSCLPWSQGWGGPQEGGTSVSIPKLQNFQSPPVQPSQQSGEGIVWESLLEAKLNVGRPCSCSLFSELFGETQDSVEEEEARETWLAIQEATKWGSEGHGWLKGVKGSQGWISLRSVRGSQESTGASRTKLTTRHSCKSLKQQTDLDLPRVGSEMPPTASALPSQIRIYSFLLPSQHTSRQVGDM